ncbi:MAG: prepilin-type N-terminal cleavage/methylation domain-containing protein [Phycisphaerales bacterium]|nr:MAG: prepilin-type N-terminal cleavage/methylation domain-containing protein [Phycisphaerales bacterium]
MRRSKVGSSERKMRCFGRAGFTIVEVLVASTIGGFVALVAVSTLKAISTSAEIVEQTVEMAAEVSFASNMVTRDLVNLYRDPNVANSTLIGITEDTGDGSVSYMLLHTVGRAKARAGQPEGDVYEVEYYLVKDEEKSMLMRRLWPYPNRDLDPGGILTVIAENIDVFEVRYFDGEEWSVEWPEEMETLPAVVEVNIVAVQQGRRTPIMESVFVNLVRSAGDSAETLSGESGESGTGGTGGAGGTGGPGSGGGGGDLGTPPGR